MDSFVKNLKATFVGRTIGFYLNLGSCALAIITVIYYLICEPSFASTDLSVPAVVFPLVGALLFIIASFFGYEQYGGIAMWVCSIIAFICFGTGIFMSFNEVFVNMAVSATDVPLFVCTGLFLVNWIYALAVSFLVRNRAEKAKKEEALA